MGFLSEDQVTFGGGQLSFYAYGRGGTGAGLSDH